MRKILKDGQEIPVLLDQSLPMLVHGKEGSGASMYTICLAAQWFTQGREILFLCGYPMAEKKFNEEVGNNHEKATFFTQDKISEFLSALARTSFKTIIIVKNIELFDYPVFKLVSSKQNIIISGDIHNVTFKDKLLAKKFTTEVYFSPLEGKKLPPIEKYHGYMVSDGNEGFTSLG